MSHIRADKYFPSLITSSAAEHLVHSIGDMWISSKAEFRLVWQGSMFGTRIIQTRPICVISAFSRTPSIIFLLKREFLGHVYIRK